MFVANARKTLQLSEIELSYSRVRARFTILIFYRGKKQILGTQE